MTPEPKRDDEQTGFPGVRTWRGVYGLVLAVFAIWVLLLVWLTRAFS